MAVLRDDSHFFFAIGHMEISFGEIRANNQHRVLQEEIIPSPYHPDPYLSSFLGFPSPLPIRGGEANPGPFLPSTRAQGGEGSLTPAGSKINRKLPPLRLPPPVRLRHAFSVALRVCMRARVCVRMQVSLVCLCMYVYESGSVAQCALFICVCVCACMSCECVGEKVSGGAGFGAPHLEHQC